MASAATALATAKRYMDHYKTLDAAALKDVLLDDYVQIYLPTSVTPPPREPGQTQKQWYLNWAGNVLPAIMTGYEMVVSEYIIGETEDGKNRVVTVFSKSKSSFRQDIRDPGDSDDEWFYSAEYVFVITMDETGEKISKIVEFVDSKSLEGKFMALVTKAFANVAKKNEAK
jgi:ketosteroid isomerase-like protein